MEDKIFHTTDVMPEEGRHILFQYETGVYWHYIYSIKDNGLHDCFKPENRSSKERWCYVDDLNKIK